jgi:hypothetical protein
VFLAIGAHLGPYEILPPSAPVAWTRSIARAIRSSIAIKTVIFGLVMNKSACELEHSVEAEVSPSFAWSWRTDVKNWDDPPAQFQLDGPFARGSWGTTRLPGQAPMRWQLREVRPGTSFVIEMPLDQAVLSFEWAFEPVSNSRTRMTQRIVLSGANSTAYANQVRATFGLTLADGMKKIADAMLNAARSTGANGNRQ